jgi:predicted RNase H-like HicB family nuclease
MRYAVVIEDAGANYSAYVPDLPGCIATGATIEEVEHRIRGAIEMHLTGMREDGKMAIRFRRLRATWNISTWRLDWGNEGTLAQC